MRSYVIPHPMIIHFDRWLIDPYVNLAFERLTVHTDTDADSYPNLLVDH